MNNYQQTSKEWQVKYKIVIFIGFFIWTNEWIQSLLLDWFVYTDRSLLINHAFGIQGAIFWLVIIIEYNIDRMKAHKETRLKIESDMRYEKMERERLSSGTPQT